jgi:hypothetical protein
MQIFLSWSGERSNAVAQLLSDWLPQVIQAAEPFISTTIEKGRRWSAEIAEKLASAPVGIICVTRDNLRAPWLLFESGAISKPRDGHVCTFLLDVEPADVEPPLGDFQHTRAHKSDVYRLVQTVNGALALYKEKPLTESVLERVFERNWPELELQLQTIRESQLQRVERPRSDRELLEEILALVRRSEAAPEMWREAAFVNRLVDVPITIETARSRPNAAFVYSVRAPNVTSEQLTRSIAEIERLDGLVTCHALSPNGQDQMECVFLRPAESDLAQAMRNAGTAGYIARSRSVTWEWSPERLEGTPNEEQIKSASEQPGK